MSDGRVSFQWKGVTPGRHTLHVRILPVPRELTLDNNQAQVEIEVMEDVIKVLVADDLPRWEFRYVVNLFKRDKHVAFEQLLFEPNDDAQSQAAHLTPSFPRDMAGWTKYRVIILGNVTSRPVDARATGNAPEICLRRRRQPDRHRRTNRHAGRLRWTSPWAP